MPSHHRHLHRQVHERREAHAAASDFTQILGEVNAERREPAPALPSSAFTRRQVVNWKHHTSFDRRDEQTQQPTAEDHTINILLTVLTVVFCSMIFFSVVLLFRRKQRSREINEKSQLPEYQGGANPHNLTIETTHNGYSSCVVIGRDGRPMLKNSSAPPNSPDNVPEIRITFPDEQDKQGQNQQGRVLIVRVGDNASVGLEPVQDDQLPAYEKEAKGQFYSIDMDQIGGLKDEKDRAVFK